MPRAENRKKPVGPSGGGKQGGFQNKQSAGATGGAFGQANSKKQDLIAKMKNKLAEKTSDA